MKRFIASMALFAVSHLFGAPPAPTSVVVQQRCHFHERALQHRPLVRISWGYPSHPHPRPALFRIRQHELTTGDVSRIVNVGPGVRAFTTSILNGQRVAFSVEAIDQHDAGSGPTRSPDITGLNCQ